MMTNAATAARPPHAATVTVTQKVVIVNGNPEMLDILETVLDAGHYDVVFVESSEHAYSQIKRVQPNLAIICVDLDEADGFQVLSMLKLDEETRGIEPVSMVRVVGAPRTEPVAIAFRDAFDEPVEDVARSLGQGDALDFKGAAAIEKTERNGGRMRRIDGDVCAPRSQR